MTNLRSILGKGNGKLKLLLVVSLLVNGVLLFRNQDQLRVIEVLDGDTVRIKNGDRVRLVGIDAPEKEECAYDLAKQELEAWVLGEAITIKEERRDFWGRRLGLVYVEDTLINEEMVRSGFAVLDSSAHSQQSKLNQAYTEAAEKQVGLSVLCQ